MKMFVDYESAVPMFDIVITADLPMQFRYWYVVRKEVVEVPE